MCIKWFKNINKYEKIAETKRNEENYDKNKILNKQEIKFKKWYRSEFKEELQHNCFKSLLESNS